MNKSINKLFTLKNKNIIITGSAGRLGSEFSTILSEAGANIILIDVDKKNNSKLEKHLQKKYKTKAKSYVTNIKNANEILELKNNIANDFKNIHGLINNAHVSFSPKLKKFCLEDYPLSVWNEYLEIHLTGTFLMCKEFGPMMVNNNSGSIVNISSIYGIVGPDQKIYGKSRLFTPPSYSAVKSGILNLTRYFATYWEKKNVRVNTLTPGGVEDKKYQSSEFIKNYSSKTILGRMAKKNDYNGAILFLMSDASKYMTGSNLIIDGGWTAW